MTRRGAVACGNPATAAAAVSTLEAGGNAVDAALAAGFAAAVAEPGLTSLGGGGFLLYRDATGTTHLLDFFVDAPGHGLPPSALAPHFTPITVAFSGADQVFHAGYGSVAVPGVLDGYLTAHRRFGLLPLSEVLEPARQCADQGVPLAPAQAEVLALIHDIVTLTPRSRAVFAPGDARLRAGDLLRNPSYANFLARLDEDVTGWRDIDEGRQLVADMAAHDGLLTLADLQSYQVVDRPPLQATFRGARITANPAPSFGGAIITNALAGLTALAGLADSSAGDATMTVDLITSLITATEQAKQRPTPRSTKGTTHISIVDGDGGLASMTTSNGSCSGVMAAGSGVQLNNVMGEADLHPVGFHATPPGTRVGSMMCPLLLDLPDGRVVAMGSGGSERIRSALTTTIVQLVEDNASLTDAVLAPRIHHDGVRIQVEPGVGEDLATALTQVAPVNRWSRPNLYFGGVHAVLRHPDGRVEAVGDPRRDGIGRVVDL